MAANESQADSVKGNEEPEKMAAEVPEEDIPDPDEDDLDDLDGEPETLSHAAVGEAPRTQTAWLTRSNRYA